MAMKQRETIITDVLIIGAGIGGLRAAEMAKRYDLDVIIADKSTGRSNLSSVSGGTMGIVSGYWSLSMPNSLDLRKRSDRWQIGCWYAPYCDDQVKTEIVTIEDIPRADEFADFGVLNPRGVRTYGPPGRVGWAHTGPLYHYVQKVGCKLMNFFCITDLLTVDGTVVGAVGFDVRNGDFITVKAKAVVMATGGASNCWARNNGVYRTTGDGHAIAYRNGVEMRMMEFEAFDAWIIAEKGLPQYWIPPSYGRTFGEIRNANGEEFFHNYIELGPDATLKPGDPFHIKYGVPVIDQVAAIARGMAMEVHEGRGDEGAILVDFSKVPDDAWEVEPKGIAFLHLMRNFDYKKKPVHMYPGALGSNGGITITDEGETNLRGLFAGGEVSYQMSLGHSNVFGTRAGRTAANYAMDAHLMDPDPIQIGEKKDYLEEFLARPESADDNPKVIRKEIQDISMDHFGVLRTEEGIKEGLLRLNELKKIVSENLYATDPRELRLAVEVDNMLLCQEMTGRAALLRTESRGAHTRLDYPYMDNDLWLKEIRIKKVNGVMEFYTSPIRRGGYMKIPKGRIPIKGLPQPK